jgi:hypothetical protein
LPRGFHLDEGCNATNSTEATRTAAKRRSGGTARRRGQRTPSMAPRRRGARGRHQAARKACSPPCASLSELLDDEAASTAGNRRWRRKPRVRVPEAAAHGAKGGAGCSGRQSRGQRMSYKGLGRPLGVQATHREACLARTRRRRRSTGRRRAELGDDRWVP